eukprot:scaffold45123_cov161-Skeletonema_marinoi.AAC.1
MATSNLSLKSMLSKERVQHVRWTAISSLLTNHHQELQNPVWREHLSQWFFHALETIEQFDGNRGTFHRSVAHVAMKILDMFISSRSMECQLLARMDERIYKSIAWACLYNACVDAASMLLPVLRNHRLLIYSIVLFLSTEESAPWITFYTCVMPQT